jgi:hypothetical protein
MNISTIRTEINQLTPESGFNVILMDSFAPEGEKLTMVKHTETKQEALQVQSYYQELAKNGDVYAEQVFIYDNNALSDFDGKVKLQFQGTTSI